MSKISKHRQRTLNEVKQVFITWLPRFEAIRHSLR